MFFTFIQAFPVLPPNDLINFVSDSITEKIKLADFSNGSSRVYELFAFIGNRLDYITSRLLYTLHGVRVSPERPSIFTKFVIDFFQTIGCNVQPFDIFDFFPKRDPKKWMRILSHLIQFNRSMQPVHNLYNQVIYKLIKSLCDFTSVYWRSKVKEKGCDRNWAASFEVATRMQTPAE